MQETLFHLAGGAAPARNALLDAGKPIVWDATQAPPVIAAQVTLPDGSQSQAQAKINGGQSTVTYAQTLLPGLYAVHFTPAQVPQPAYFGVNPAASELDFRPPSETRPGLAQRRQLRPGPPRRRRPANRYGPRLPHHRAPWLAFAVLGVLLMETFMTCACCGCKAEN